MNNAGYILISKEELQELLLKAVTAGFNCSYEGGNGDYDPLFSEQGREEYLTDIAKNLVKSHARLG